MVVRWRKGSICASWGIPALVVLLILFGTRLPMLSVAAFGLLAVFALAGKQQNVLEMLFFLMPFANIFKSAPGAQSFFTYVLLLFAVRMVVRTGVLHHDLIAFAILVIGQQIIANSFGATKTIKLITNLYFLQIGKFFNLRQSWKELFRKYVFGVLLASLLAAVDLPLFRIYPYIGLKALGKSYGFGDVGRFAGMDTDPNYYSVNVLLVMALLVLLHHRKEISLLLFALGEGLCLWFVVLTYSKSAALMLPIPMMMFFWSNHKNKRYTLQGIFLLAMLAVAIAAVCGKIPMFNVVILRLQKARGDLNALTTGRLEIWKSYLLYFWFYPVRFLFGSGINGTLFGREAHNTLLQSLYGTGVLGTVSLFRIVRHALRGMPRSDKCGFLNYAPLLMVCGLYCFLSELLYYDAPFQVMLACIAMRVNFEPETKQSGEMRR